MIALRFKSFTGSVYLLVLLLLLPTKPHSFLFLAGVTGNSAREDKMCDEHDTSEQYYLQRSTNVCKRKPHLRQQNNRSKSYSNKPTSPPLVNGHTNYFSLTGDGCYENGHEDNDGVEEDKNSSHTSRVLVDSVAHADFFFDEDNGNSDNAAGESNGSENNSDSNFDNEDKNDAAADDDDDYPVTKSSSLPVDSIAPGKIIKDILSATEENLFSLPVNTGLDDQVRSQTIAITAGDNNGNTASYPPILKPKTSSPRFSRGNWAELDYLCKSKIPSLEATGINQKFLERHTTDPSLQHVSQPGDFNLPKNSTPLAEWPMWSLPPPDASETGHRWRHSSGLQPSFVGNQTGGQSNWNDEPRALKLPTVKSHTPKATATVTELQPSAGVTSWSVPSYSYQSSVLPENGQERFLEPSTPNSFTENQEHVHPVTSSEISPLRKEDQRNGALALSPEFPDDPSLAALERKVAEVCAVVERVMKEREERTKAQREAARKKREMREQREREAREMREREEREREERKMRERQEREIRDKERREPVENEDRDTRWFGGERAPVQESPRWQCVHYQRRCLVKFPCCGIFYPCHRCHNTSGACDTDDRKANNATHVKCGICGHEEEVSGFVLTVIPMNCFAHSRCA